MLHQVSLVGADEEPPNKNTVVRGTWGTNGIPLWLFLGLCEQRAPYLETLARWTWLAAVACGHRLGELDDTGARQGAVDTILWLLPRLRGCHRSLGCV